MATYHLQIVTPDCKVFDGEAEKLSMRTLGGDVCILARHIDYAAPLGTGPARVTDGEGNTRVAACSGGMLSVSGGEVRVMATTFEWADDIDLARAERARDEAQARLDKLNHADKEYAVEPVGVATISPSPTKLLIFPLLYVASISHRRKDAPLATIQSLRQQYSPFISLPHLCVT